MLVVSACPRPATAGTTSRLSPAAGRCRRAPTLTPCRLTDPPPPPVCVCAARPADRTPPTLHLPDPLPAATTEATGPSGAVVSFGLATASDLVTPNIAVSCSHQPDTVFPIGVTTVRCNAQDGANNAAAALEFTVTVGEWLLAFGTACHVQQSVDMSVTATDSPHQPRLGRPHRAG